MYGISHFKAKSNAKTAMLPPTYPILDKEMLVITAPPSNAPQPIPTLKVDENMAMATVAYCGT